MPTDRHRLRRIRKLRNAIKRLEEVLAVRDAVPQNVRTGLAEVLVAARNAGSSREDLIDDVEDWLDERIEPRSPLAEWLSDVAIDVAALVAVDLWLHRRDYLAAQLDRKRRKLAALEARADG